MKIGKYLLACSILALCFIGCSSDDDGDVDVTPVEEEDRAEQQIIDNDSLIGYFETHYYNSEELSMHPNPSISDIIISELLDGESVPTGHTLLSDNNVLIEETSSYLDVEYTYYILKIQQGGGEASPNFSDTIFLNYQGSLQDETIFDGTATPATFDLVSLVAGWRRVLPQFNVAENSENPNINSDGTVSYDNPGIGVMFIPSGLAYYSSSINSIPAYSNLIFKFELFRSQENDHDGDGIPSFIEDLNTNLEVSDDDTDEDALPNYFDFDDDDDGVLTIDELQPKEYTINIGEPDPIFGEREFEISRTEDNGTITINTVTITDSDGDGTDDYLDANITTNYNE